MALPFLVPSGIPAPPPNAALFMPAVLGGGADASAAQAPAPDGASPTDTVALSPQATVDAAPVGSPQPDFSAGYAYKDSIDFTSGALPAGYAVGNDTFHGGNGELQQYSPSQVQAVPGQGVTLTAAPNPDPNAAIDSPYVSGKIYDTQRGVSTGAIEFTATMPKGSGLWPALWLLPKGQNGADGGNPQWPQTGEIDVAELMGSDTTKSMATLHWGDIPGQDSSPGSFATTDGATDYADGQPHKFAALWDGYGITSFVDGKKVGYQPFDDKMKATFASGQQFSPVINLAVGGKFDGSLYDPSNPDWRNQVKQRIDAAGTFANGQTPSMTISNVTLYSSDPASGATFDAPPATTPADARPPAEAA